MVDVVIGVDTHVQTHSAAVIDAATGGVLDEITVEATAQGYCELVEFATNHCGSEEMSEPSCPAACPRPAHSG